MAVKCEVHKHSYQSPDFPYLESFDTSVFIEIRFGSEFGKIYLV